MAFSPRAVDEGRAHQLLDHTWLGRWERSDSQVPVGVEPEPFKSLVRGHPQFARGLIAGDTALPTTAAATAATTT